MIGVLVTNQDAWWQGKLNWIPIYLLGIHVYLPKKDCQKSDSTKLIKNTFSYGQLKKITCKLYFAETVSFIQNKTFKKKRKNRALLILRRSQKHCEIFSNNVLRKNISRTQLRMETIEIAWFKVGSVPWLWEILFHILCIVWLRDLQSETLFTLL